MLISIDDIGVSERIRKRIEKVPELAASLQEYGLIHAITVRPATVEERETLDKPWRLVTGGRRLAAAIMLGWNEIRAEDFAHLTPFRRMAIELEENIQRDDMHFADICETKLRLHELYLQENPGQTLEQTAKAIGETVANVSRDLALAREIREQPELRQASSKKAAAQAVKMQSHHKMLKNQLSQKDVYIRSLEANVETADMRDWLLRQPEGSIDLLLSDLPYGIDYWDTQFEQSSDLSDFDDSRQGAEDLFLDAVPKMLRAVSKNGWLVLFTGWETFFSVKGLIETCCVKHFEYQTEKLSRQCAAGLELNQTCEYIKCQPKPWIWYRPNSRNNSMHPDLYAQNQYEVLLVCNRGEAKLSGLDVSKKGNVLVYDADYGQRIHDHQKPLPLLEDLIERFTLRGQLVADCCFGSGTTLAAAAKTSRHFKGCEANPNMRNPALGMIAQYYKGEVTLGKQEAPGHTDLMISPEAIDELEVDEDVIYEGIEDEEEDEVPF